MTQGRNRPGPATDATGLDNPPRCRVPPLGTLPVVVPPVRYPMYSRLDRPVANGFNGFEAS